MYSPPEFISGSHQCHFEVSRNLIKPILQFNQAVNPALNSCVKKNKKKVVKNNLLTVGNDLNCLDLRSYFLAKGFTALICLC